METNEKTVRDFFSSYEQRFNESLAGKQVDVKGALDSFADCFVESSPAGVICGKNDTTFSKNIVKGFEKYRTIGTEKMTIHHLDITRIDELHMMATVAWQYDAIRKKDSKAVRIDFQVIYLLQIQHNQPKIFAYITGDEQKALKDNGLLN